MTPLLGTFSVGSARGYGRETSAGVAGQQTYTTAGTYTFVVPAGVTSVSVVCVGASKQYSNQTNYGLGGGGLGYKNNITVVPGNSYEVVVSGANDGRGSHFINTSTVLGGQSISNSGGGTFVGDGGGNGGNGGAGTGGSSGAGGGGAGGYAGNGGNGGKQGANNGSAAASGSGGGGGGAGGTSGSFGGGGGGVGLFGIGADGAAGLYAAEDSYILGGGGGGSGGTRGSRSNTAGAYGDAAYGGGLPGTGATVSAGNYGGAVRIIWGAGRSFPSNAANV